MFTIENYLLVGLFISSINSSIVMPSAFPMMYVPTVPGYVSNIVLWPVVLWRWINLFFPANKGDE